MTHALISTIVTSYELLELTPAQIGEQEGLETASVEAILSLHSQKWKSNLRVPAPKIESVVDEGFGQLYAKTEVDLAKEVLVSLALSSEVDRVKYEASKFILNEAQGRHKRRKPNAIITGGVNIFVFNEQLKRARESRERMLEEAGIKETLAV